jgi:hypothetical protein
MLWRTIRLDQWCTRGDAQHFPARFGSGIGAHERYWRTVARLAIACITLTSCALWAADGLGAWEDAFLQEWGRALRVWVSLCARALGGSS